MGGVVTREGSIFNLGLLEKEAYLEKGLIRETWGEG